MAFDNVETKMDRVENTISTHLQDSTHEMGERQMREKLASNQSQIESVKTGIQASFKGISPKLQAWVAAGFTDEMKQNPAKYPAYAACLNA